MSKPQITWAGATLSHQITLPNLRPLAAAGVYTQDAIPRKGFNWLWGWVAADDTFTCAVFFNDINGVPGMGWLGPSVVDPVTALNVVDCNGIHLSGATWGITITGVGLNMANIFYYLEVKP